MIAKFKNYHEKFLDEKQIVAVVELMLSVKFMPDNRVVVCKLGDIIMDVAKKAGIEILGPCGGNALCGRCLIKVLDGEEALNTPTDDEKLLLGEKKLSERYRLACRCRVIKHGNVVIYIPLDSRTRDHVLLVEGLSMKERHDPLLKKIETTISRRTVQSITESMWSTKTDKSLSFSLEVLRKTSRLVHDKDRKVMLILHGDHVLDVKEDGKVLGFAVDVGTTKLAGYLVDVIEGKTLATTSDINPQIVYGEDLVSRITYSIKNGVRDLHDRVIERINDLMEKTCDSIGSNTEDIYEIVAVGNSVMHHILLGLDLRSLAYFPYTPLIKEPLYLRATDIGLHANTEARIFLPPLIAGYIGSDVVADILAVDMQYVSSPTMLIDIGTNTEIVIGKERRFIACSTASGPAFEGAHIKFGMRAAKGAIDKVKISSEGDVVYSVIGGVKPLGLTGSAVVDAIAELYENGLLDFSGKLSGGKNFKRIRKGDQGYLEFVIAYKDESAINSDIVLTQKDIREIQLAKAAIRTGIRILTRKLGIREEDIEQVYIAGAFGFFLNPVSAIKIGMLPEIDIEKIRLVGNTAGVGAKSMLLSESLRRESLELTKRIEYVELANEQDFQSEFINCIPLPKDVNFEK